MRWMRVAALLLSLPVISVTGRTAELASGSSFPADRFAVAKTPVQIGDFELVDKNGRGFGLAELRRQPALVFFGYTQCNDVCPVTLQQLRMLTAAPGAPLRGITVVMISVDGDRDTPAVLKSFLATWPPELVALTGDPHLVRRLAARFHAVFFKGLPDDPGGSYQVQHTSQVYLTDRDGRLRATFYDAPPETIARIAQTLLCGPAQRPADLGSTTLCDRPHDSTTVAP